MIGRCWIAGALLTLFCHSARAQTVTSEYGPAYLAYAGPYSASPSSAFGHLFLVLARAPDDPPPLWDVVTFTAVTLDVDPVRYLTVGILGGFLGRYSRLKFHQKTREYELLDDRDLWLVELRLSMQQRQSLEAAIARTTGRWYPYTFFSRNCAYYLQALLSEATDVVEAPAGIVSPAGVMTAVLRTPVAGRSFARPAVSQRIMALGATGSRGAVDRLAGQSWRTAVADTAWLAALPPRDLRLVHEVVQLRAAEASAAFEPATRDGVTRLRLLAAAGSPASDEVVGPGRETPPPRFHRYPRVQVRYVAAASVPTRLSLQWRGAMHDELDPWLVHRPLSTMELLSVELSSPVARPSPRLESAVLFSQRSLVPSTWTKRRTSWMAELHVRRGGLFGADTLHGELRTGLGRAQRLPLETYAYGLATLAGVATFGHGAALAPGVELGLVSLPLDRVRLGVRWSREHDVASWTRVAQRVRGWARLDLSSRLGVHSITEHTVATTTYALGFDWYP